MAVGQDVLNAVHAAGDDGKAERHRLEEGVRKAFPKRRENEGVEGAKQWFWITMLAQKPRFVSNAKRLDEGLDPPSLPPLAQDGEARAGVASA